MNTSDKQHIISQVYLKKFGYIDAKTNGWKVSVIEKEKIPQMHKIGQMWISQKFIESFLRENNVFDIISSDSKVASNLEDLNQELENLYNQIIIEIDQKGKLNEENLLFLLQYISDILCRSTFWRRWVEGMLNHPNKENFIRTIYAPHVSHSIQNQEMTKEEVNEFVTQLIKLPTDEALNRVLLIFIEYLYFKLFYFDYYFLEAPKNRGWYTSDNPVILKIDNENKDLMGKNSEIIFPLSKDILVYLHHIDNQNLILDTTTLSPKQNTKVNLETYDQIMKMIIYNAVKFVVIEGEYRDKIELI